MIIFGCRCNSSGFHTLFATRLIVSSVQSSGSPNPLNVNILIRPILIVSYLSPATSRLGSNHSNN